MNKLGRYRVVLGPYTTEKTANAANHFRQHAFKVVKKAKKPDIKKAVEALFGVKVVSVQVANILGKQKRNGRTKDWKKAWVTLVSGQNIDYTSLM